MLLADLEARGLLDETLVVFGTEFGRSPVGEQGAMATGRDHHTTAFSMFLAGGGVKRGFVFGETDDIGWTAARDAVDISDVHATILELFGIAPDALSFRHDGLDQRIIPVTRRAAPIRAILA
jgi:uncharacterized protein (DUF1501 family)